MRPAAARCSRPGRDDDLQQRLAAALPADVALDPPEPAIGFVHRRLRDADVYFLANTSNVARTVRAALRRSDAPTSSSWDPMTGAIEQRRRASGDAMTLAFEPHGSRIVVFRKSAGTRSAIDARAARSAPRSCGQDGR